jgi:hypothetical protein
MVGESLASVEDKEICMKRLASVGLLLLAVAAVPLGASTFLFMSDEELVKSSAAVVEGRVLQVSSFWEKTGRIIVSEALVRVDDALFGDVPTVVKVRTFGGTVNGFTVEAHGFPTFKANERVLLYLEAERDGVSRVTGYQQGHFRIVRDKAGVDVAVPTVDNGGHFVTLDGRPVVAPKAVRLDALKSAIRNEARRAGRVIFEN